MCCRINVEGDHGQRVLTGKYTPEKTLSETSGIYYNKERPIQVKPPIRMMQETGQKNDCKSPAEGALNWLMHKGRVLIPGLKDIPQASSWMFTDEGER